MLSGRIYGCLKHGAVFLGNRIDRRSAVGLKRDGAGIVPLRIKRHIAGRAESYLVDPVFKRTVGKPSSEGISALCRRRKRYLVLNGIRRRIGSAVRSVIKYIRHGIYRRRPFCIEREVSYTVRFYGSIRNEV